MGRNVLLPIGISKRLDVLAGLNEEVNGILLYESQGDSCPIKKLFMLGVGSEGSVWAQQDRLEVADEFLRRYTTYNYVRFHTHSKGTIEKFGDYYAWHFSEEDIKIIGTRLKSNEDFIAMLVTPRTKLLCGKDRPRLRITKNPLEYEEIDRVLEQRLKRIGKDLGYYGRIGFQAKRRR